VIPRILRTVTIATVASLAAVAPAPAADWEVVPHVGFRVGGSFDEADTGAQIDFDGTPIWNGQVLQGREELQARLRGVAAMPLQPDVHLRPNRLAKYGAVAGVMASARNTDSSAELFHSRPSRSKAGGTMFCAKPQRLPRSARAVAGTSSHSWPQCSLLRSELQRTEPYAS